MNVLRLYIDPKENFHFKSIKTVPKVVGIVNNILKTVPDIYLKQVTVQQHTNEISYSDRNNLLFKNATTHLNQQLAAPLKRFCVKLLSDCKEFDPEIFSYSTLRYFLPFFQWHLSWYFLSRHVKISDALSILLVIFVEI